MKKLTAFLCVLAGLHFAACSSRPISGDMSQNVPDAGQSDSAQAADAGQAEASRQVSAAADADQTEASSQTSVAKAEPEAGLERYADAVPVVYMTTEITAKSLCRLYQSMGRAVTGDHTAVKISTGEPPASNYLKPELICDLVQYVDGTIVECNTAYGGSRAETEMHYQVAKDHGFTEIADVVIMDEDGSVTLPVEDGVHLTENYVGAHFPEYDGFLIISHFKGHAMAGFGGAIKNMSIGISSAEGKCLIHSAGSSRTDPWGTEQDAFLESMAEAGKSVADALDRNILYINVMNHLSIDCDCNGDPAEPDIHDIGILASADPVALDQACVDLIYMADGNEAFVEQMEEKNAEYVLEYAEEIGLGNSAYTLVKIDRR